MFLQLAVSLGSMILVIVLWLFAQHLLNRRRARRASAKMHKLVADDLPVFEKSMLDDVPEPVARYFSAVMRIGQRPVRFAKVSQSGAIRDKDEDEWREFSATAAYSGVEPSMMWDAVISMQRSMWRTAQLFYANNHGRTMYRFLGGIRIMDSAGHEASASLLFRYLSEALWFPTALLPGNAVEWYPIDEHSAKAVIRDEDLSAAAVFHFGAGGEVERIVTHEKFRDYRGIFCKEPFTLHCGDYQVHHNIRIPSRLEFEWQRGSKGFRYARFQVEEVEYEF